MYMTPAKIQHAGPKRGTERRMTGASEAHKVDCPWSFGSILYTLGVERTATIHIYNRVDYKNRSINTRYLIV